ncbi:unnamed protein product [Allacma fusca]|uniref:FHA domain-containing protein n=1 Tax=Allacma fusca TaxID=39272 RepID=A0A8J2L3F6_9HEXA|nr:unnamed protein product [Allacma fusca]
MVYNTNAETMGGCRINLRSIRCEKVYGYLDLFKYMGDSCPMQTYPMTLTKVTIGRNSECQIRIKNNRVSRQQCAVTVVYNHQRHLEVRLKNLTSRLTTVHRNKAINPGEDVVLHHGDRFRLYDVELRYRLYDPINEKGQLDWTRPIPIIKLTPLTPQKTSDKMLPLIKITAPANELQANPNPSNLNTRRQSFPLSTSKTKMDFLKLPRRNSTPVDDSRRRLTDLDVANKHNNKKPLLISNNKRRGSSDFDMRKAVLQRSFRRAFKEKIIQGSFVDVDDGRFRKALEDFIVLSSAA